MAQRWASAALPIIDVLYDEDDDDDDADTQAAINIIMGSLLGMLYVNINNHSL